MKHKKEIQPKEKERDGKKKEKQRKYPLTVRELQVLRLVSEGWNNKEVAAKLKLSEDTIDTHNRNIIKRLGAKNMKEAIAIGFRMKLNH